MLPTGPAAPVRAAATADGLPFMASISAVAAARSVSLLARSVLSNSDATRNDTPAAPMTDRITPG